MEFIKVRGHEASAATNASRQTRNPPHIQQGQNYSVTQHQHHADTGAGPPRPPQSTILPVANGIPLVREQHTRTQTRPEIWAQVTANQGRKARNAAEHRSRRSSPDSLANRTEGRDRLATSGLDDKGLVDERNVQIQSRSTD